MYCTKGAQQHSSAGFILTAPPKLCPPRRCWHPYVGVCCRLSQQDPSTAGYTLTHLVKALQLCLAAPSAGRAFRGNSLLQQATLAVAGLATLVVCRTQLTMDAEDDLQELLQVWGGRLFAHQCKSSCMPQGLASL